jgi:hypothetical protein
LKHAVSGHATGLMISAALANSAGCATVLGLDGEYRNASRSETAGGRVNQAMTGGQTAQELGGEGGASGGTPSSGGAALGGSGHGGGDATSSGASTGGGASAGASVSTGGGGAGGKATGGDKATGASKSTGGAAAGGSSGNCAGISFDGTCWYLGPTGQSCTVTCSEHGGYDARATAFVGVPAQGGSLGRCQALLTALGVSAVAVQATRSDGLGIGCHLFGRDAYWLQSPTFDPSTSCGNVRIVCGCVN